MICLHSVLQLSPLFLKLFHHLTQKLCTHQVITSYSSQPQDPVKFCFTSCVYEFLYSRYPIQVVTNATSAFLCLIWVVACVRTSFLFFFLKQGKWFNGGEGIQVCFSMTQWFSVPEHTTKNDLDTAWRAQALDPIMLVLAFDVALLIRIPCALSQVCFMEGVPMHPGAPARPRAEATCHLLAQLTYWWGPTGDPRI